MSTLRSTRPLRLSPTLALLVGLGAALPAADFVTTVSVSASQTPGGVYVVGSGTVTYTVNFAETVVPGYLTGFLAENKADVAVTGATSIYDLVDLTNNTDAAAGDTTIKMVTGRQMQVVVANLTNGEEASLAITQGKFKGVDSDGALTGNVNAAVTEKLIRVMLPSAGTYHAKIDTPAYSMLESGAILLSGDFADATPADYDVAPAYPDYVVKVTGSSAQVNAYTLASGAWTAIVPAPAALGRLTLTATPTDVVNSAGATGTTPTVAVYVGQKPAIALAQVVNTDTAPYDTTYTSGIKVGHGKPGFSGTAGLPRDIDGTINGTLDAAGGRIKTKIDIFGADPVATPSTPPLITQKIIADADYGGTSSDANAAWSLTSADYGSTTLSNGTYYLRVVTEVEDIDGATGGTVTGVGTFSQVFTFQVDTSAPSAPVVDLDTSSGGDQTTFSTSDNTPTIAVVLSGKAMDHTNTVIEYSDDDGSTWNAFTLTAGNTTAGTGTLLFTPDTGEALGDEVYKLRATFTDVNGLSATTLTPSTLTIGTPVPTLTVTSLAADHKPDITVALTGGTPSQSSIEVQVKLTADGDGTYATRAGYLSGSGPYTWTPTAPLPDGAYSFRARWTSPDNKTSAWSTVATATIATPTPALSADGFTSANVDVLASLPTADGNNQYLISDLKPKIKIGAWADFGTGKGTFEMYRLTRGTNGAVITPYTVTNDASGHLITNTIGAGTGAVIAGTVTQDGADAYWVPDAAFGNEEVWSLVGKWTDANSANATADDSVAGNGSEVNAVASASNVFNLRVLSAVDAPALTGYSPSTDSDFTPDTPYTGTSIVVSNGAMQIHGTGNPYATLQMYLGANKETQLASITVPADGKWVYEFSSDSGVQSTALVTGTNILSFRQIDLASTTPSSYAPSITVTVDGGAPSVPSITEVEDSTADGITTADSTPEFEGTATPGAFVNLSALASTLLTSAGDNNNLQFVSKTQGNSVTLSLVESGNNTPLSIAVTGTATPYTVTVNLATDGSGNSTSTANDVIALIQGDSTANALISVALSGADASGNTGAGVIPASVSAASDAGSLTAAVTADSVEADVGSGAWATSSGRASPTLTAAATPGRLHRIFAQGKSQTGVLSGYSAGRDVYVLSPSMKIYLEPISKGDGGGYQINNAAGFPVGRTVITLDSGSETDFNTVTANTLEDANADGDILVGDIVTFAGDTTEYRVVSGLRGAAGNITISPGLKSAKADNVAMTIQSNAKGPASKGNGNTTPSSLSQILLTAIFKDGAGNPIDEVITAGFPKTAIDITGGTVTSVTKGTGAVGQQPTNVWTIAITPATTDGEMSVSIPAGRIATTPGKVLDAITVVTPGAYYVGTPTFTVTGGAPGSAVVTWTDDGDDMIEDGELAITDPGYGFSTTASLAVAPSPGSGALGLALTVSGGAIATVGGAAADTVTAFPVVTKGSNYAAAPAVVFTGGAGTNIVPPVATAALGGTGGKQVVSVTFSSLGSGYTSAPTMSFKTGSGFKATIGLKAGDILYNEASVTTPSDAAYTLDVDRTKPKPEWQFVNGSTALRSSIALVDGTVMPATGNYVLLSSTPSETSFTLRAAFPSVMNRALVPSDLTLSGCVLDTTFDTDGIQQEGGSPQNFLIKVKRGGVSSTVTTMSVTVKAAPAYDHDSNTSTPSIVLSDTSLPAQTSLASVAFAATVVPVPTAPVIKSSVGLEGVPARTVSYPCTVTFSSAVTGFTADDLTVSNGVISKFTGSGKSYSFTLTPGEGPVTVQYTSTTGLTDVAGQSIPTSNLFQRVLDSTQPTVAAVSSQVFGVSGAVKPTNYTTQVVSGVTYALVPIRLTFSEAPKTVPTTALVATYVSNSAAVSMATPSLVPGTANKTYQINLRLPTTLADKVRLVVPALSVPDNAANQGQASGVYELEFDMVGGTAVDVGTAPYSNG